jgi:REP element-mobilizing transposase RayT
MTHVIYRRRLPHLQFIGAAFFVTWRLEGSLPKSIIAKTQAEMDEAIDVLQHRDLAEAEKAVLIARLESEYLQKLDDYLDKVKTGPHHLKQAEVAQIVMDKLHEYDGKHYRLEAFCVMSNHVHALLDFQIQLPYNEVDFDKKEYVQLETVLRNIKGGSSYQINNLLSRKGKLWNVYNFDRYIRNEQHYNTVIRYIIHNPVKAGICKDWRDYPFTYLRPL